MRLQQLCGVLFQPQAEPYPLHDQDSAGDEENDAAYPLSVDVRVQLSHHHVHFTVFFQICSIYYFVVVFQDLASIFPRCKTFNIQIWSDQELEYAFIEN
jgi:hypothetical protein